MDINPFDDIAGEAGARASRLRDHIDSLKEAMYSSTWTGPRAQHFEQNEQRLIADLERLADQLDDVAQTARRLSEEFNNDLEAARQFGESVLDFITGD